MPINSRFQFRIYTGVVIVLYLFILKNTLNDKIYLPTTTAATTKTPGRSLVTVREAEDVAPFKRSFNKVVTLINVSLKLL